MIFPHTVTLLPAVETQSPLGGLQYDYPGPGTSYSAFVQTRTETRAEVLNTAGSREATVIYILGTCPAKELDRILYAGKTYEVMGVIPARSLTDTHHTKIMTLQLDQTTR
jgi:hypothetical protein